MSQSHDKLDRQAISWLGRFSRKLDEDTELSENVPIEELRTELRDRGASVEGFHAQLSGTLHTAKLKQAGTTLLQWISPLWQPQWAGQFVGAGDIPEQSHRFLLEHGTIEIRCSWKPRSDNTPAYLDISWKTDTLLEQDLWCRFVHPETHVVLAEVLLGASNEGGKYFTPHTLGFDPSQEKWALAILIK